VDERDVVQAMNEMETIWREQMIKGYRNEPVYQLAQDSNNTSRRGRNATLPHPSRPTLCHNLRMRGLFLHTKGTWDQWRNT